MSKLTTKISKFLKTYAEMDASYDPKFQTPDEIFTSPDASELFSALQLLILDKKGIIL